MGEMSPFHPFRTLAERLLRPIADIRDKETARKPYHTNLNVAFARGHWAVAASSLELPGLPIAVNACRCNDHLLSKA